MKRRVNFVVPGEPTGKGRPRFVKYGHTYTPKKTLEYEEAVRIAYKDVANGFMFDDVPLSVSINAVFSVPKSLSQKKRERMLNGFVTKRPDLDNIAKACLDALNGIAYKDDSQVAMLSIMKFYGGVSRVEVLIEEL